MRRVEIMADSIAVLGTGHMGSGLARAFARIDRTVYLGSRDAARAEAVANEIRMEHPGAVVLPGDYATSTRASDVVVLAIPFREVTKVLNALGHALAGKIVVDITNPFGQVPPDTSGAEMHARLLPPTAALVAAWKTTCWPLLDPRERAGALHDVFVCADDEAARARVAELITETGFRPVDCGALANARVLDAMVPLLLEVDRRYNNGHRSAWKFLP